MSAYDQDLLNFSASDRLLKHLDKAGKQNQALGVFEWMEQNSVFGEEEFDTKDPFLYAQLMRMHNRTRQGCSKALQLFERMESRGVKPDLVCYNVAINAAGKPALPLFACSCCSSASRLPSKRHPHDKQPNSLMVTSVSYRLLTCICMISVFCTCASFTASCCVCFKCSCWLRKGQRLG